MGEDVTVSRRLFIRPRADHPISLTRRRGWTDRLLVLQLDFRAVTVGYGKFTMARLDDWDNLDLLMVAHTIRRTWSLPPNC